MAMAATASSGGRRIATSRVLNRLLAALFTFLLTAAARSVVASALPAINVQPYRADIDKLTVHEVEVEDTAPAAPLLELLQPASNGNPPPLPNYDPAHESSPEPKPCFNSAAASGVLKRMLYGKEEKKKSKKTKKYASRFRPKGAMKKTKTFKSSSYKKPKVVIKRKVGTKANYIKTKVMSKGKTNAPKYKKRSPVPTSYMPKGRTTRTMNPIDECWRNDPNWAQNRMHLADCAIGYGFDAAGGKGGSIYVVTNPSDDPAAPKPGTLRYGVVQLKPLWIVFDRDMSITLKNELIVTSYKTIDGRGARVEISHGPCFTIQNVDHVIIHGLSIHHCTPGKSGRVMSSTTHVGDRRGSDGDAIVIFGSSHIWIDHNYFAACQDGLVDAIHGSTAITISNNYFTNHDKVMLLGHSDSYSQDKDMTVTLAYNHFGPGLNQRMPRCRFGHFHVVNNRYTKWGMYAIGASANPTIKSEGNYFFAPDDETAKQVVKLEGGKRTSSSDWKSNGDLFLNGAYFGEEGTSTYDPSYRNAQEDFDVLPASLVPLLTDDAGPLDCSGYSRC